MNNHEFNERVLRVNDLERMKRFYRWVLGCKLIGEFPNAALLEMNSADGNRILTVGLFQRSARSKPDTGHHITVSLPRANCESRRRKLKRVGAAIVNKGRNRFCIHDPEGNEIEMICGESPTTAQLNDDRSRSALRR